MTMLGVIRKVQEPADWINSMVCVTKKTRDLRVYMDPKDLNEKIKRKHYQIPKRGKITSEMANAKFFTKLDASQGFWQLKLDEDSTKYCNFNTFWHILLSETAIWNSVSVRNISQSNGTCH